MLTWTKISVEPPWRWLISIYRLSLQQNTPTNRKVHSTQHIAQLEKLGRNQVSPRWLFIATHTPRQRPRTNRLSHYPHLLIRQTCVTTPGLGNWREKTASPTALGGIQLTRKTRPNWPTGVGLSQTLWTSPLRTLWSKVYPSTQCSANCCMWYSTCNQYAFAWW